MKKETWKYIDGFKNYKISNRGKIISVEKRIITSNGIQKKISPKTKKFRKHPKSGFLMTDLLDNSGKKRTVYIHKIVAQNFIDNNTPRKRKLVSHIDGNFNNNHVDNLIWTSHQESIKMRFDHSTEKQRKKQGPRPPLTKEQEKLAIKMKNEKGMTLRSIAQELGCSASYVLKILNINETETT